LFYEICNKYQVMRIFILLLLFTSSVVAQENPVVSSMKNVMIDLDLMEVAMKSLNPS